MLNSITPFSIVDDLGVTLEFYQSKLGFNVLHKGGDGHGNDFWAIIGRDRLTAQASGTSMARSQDRSSRYKRPRQPFRDASNSAGDGPQA